MCGLDRGFTTRGIRGRGFYGMIGSPKSCVSRQAKWSNMRKRVLTIDMLLYHLFLTL